MTDSELKSQLDRMERKIEHSSNEAFLMLLVIMLALAVVLASTLASHTNQKQKPPTAQK